jgi:hypothetical protein
MARLRQRQRNRTPDAAAAAGDKNTEFSHLVIWLSGHLIG